MEQNTNAGIKTWQWLVTVIVIIVLIILGYNMFSGSTTPTNTTPTETNTEATTTATTNNPNHVIVNDQAPGNQVFISTVQLSKPGFVVIQKDNAGKPGAIIGSQYFDAGIYPGKVTLTTPTVEGGLYYAALYLDSGDKKFTSTKDTPILDASGNAIMRPFRITVTPTEIKG